MTFADTYVTEGFAAESTKCPAMGALFGGLKKGSTDYDALTGATAGFSDGASVTLKAILTGSTFLSADRTNATAMLGCQLWMGNGLTATAAANGAYVMGVEWAAASDSKNAVSNKPTGAYHATAATKTAAALNIDTAGGVVISTGGDKYQWTAGSTGTDITDNSFFFYMPYDKTHKAKTEGELSATNGDRLDKGDEVAVYNGKRKDGDEPNAADQCGTKVVVKLGAATLAAGSVALAAALAF